ncbi:hypothetical protein BDZ91DRAFT_553169 [Kalaharituber pfeilii]|nr:hypothetical protein BDZ91DRAFT_553169 [Kalaharituber pfeilii]
MAGARVGSLKGIMTISRGGLLYSYILGSFVMKRNGDNTGNEMKYYLAGAFFWQATLGVYGGGLLQIYLLYARAALALRNLHGASLQCPAAQPCRSFHALTSRHARPLT